MWTEVLLLSFTGSLYPIALVAVAGYLGLERGLRYAWAFLLGGATIMCVTGAAILISVRLFNLTPRHLPTPSALVDIGIGLALLVLVLVLVARGHHPSQQSGEGESVDNDRSGGEPHESHEQHLWRAFAAGVVVYLPMLSYFAAIKIAAGAAATVGVAVAALVACMLVSLSVTLVPTLAVAIAGSRADPFLDTLSRLVARYTRPILLVTGGGVAVYLILKGISRL